MDKDESDRIRVRAYELYCAAGKPNDCGDRFWYEAERLERESALKLKADREQYERVVSELKQVASDAGNVFAIELGTKILEIVFQESKKAGSEIAIGADFDFQGSLMRAGARMIVGVLKVGSTFVMEDYQKNPDKYQQGAEKAASFLGNVTKGFLYVLALPSILIDPTPLEERLKVSYGMDTMFPYTGPP